MKRARTNAVPSPIPGDRRVRIETNRLTRKKTRTYYFTVAERDDRGGEWRISKHWLRERAIERALLQYNLTGLTHVIDIRSAEDDELIEEVGLVNAMTDGQFVEHYRRKS